MSAKAILIFLLTLGLCETLKAQDGGNAELPAQWDLQTCLDYAKENNIQLKNLRLSQKSSEQSLLLAKAARLPEVTGSFSHSLVHGNDVNASGALSINSSWIIYNGGYLGKDIRQKKVSLTAAGLDVETGENDLTLQITEAYLAILMDKEHILYMEDLVATSRAQVQQGRQLLNAGMIARKDLAQLEAQLAGDKYTLVTANNTRRQDILFLRQLLQVPFDIPFDIIKPDTMLAASLLPPLEEMRKRALENMPEIKSSELALAASELELEKAKAGYKPVLSLSGNLSTGYADETGRFSGQSDNDFYQQIGISLTIPLFTRRINKTKVEQAKIEVDQAKLALNDEQLILSQSVEQAYLNAANAQSRYAAAAEQLRYAKESYRIANKQLEVGAANTVEFLQQKNLYVQALQAYLQVKYDASLSGKLYEFYRDKQIEL